MDQSLHLLHEFYLLTESGEDLLPILYLEISWIMDAKLTSLPNISLIFLPLEIEPVDFQVVANRHVSPILIMRSRGKKVASLQLRI
jgi:hypothetical protein